MPDISADEVPLINQALGMIGASMIFALDEESNLAEHVTQHWPSARDHCLAIHPKGWGWAKQTFQLMQRPGTPLNQWAYAYELPGTALGGPEIVWENPKSSFEPLRDFSIEEGLIFADAPTLYGRFPVKPAVALWPPIFRQAVKTLAAAWLAVPVSHDSNLAERLRVQAIGEDRETGAGGLLGRAIAMDLNQKPLGSPLLRGDPLSDARWQ